MITVRVDKATEQIASSFKELDQKNIAKATARAINRSLSKGRTVARKAVKEEYNIPQKNLSGINKVNAYPSNLTGYIVASSKPIPADAFAPKFETAGGSISISKKGVQKTKDYKRKKSNPTKGVSIEVHKGDRQTIPFAFMIRGAKPRVFGRGKYRNGGTSFGFVIRNKRINKRGTDIPIKPLVSVTVHGAVINEKVENKLAGEVSQYYTERLAHEMSFLLSKMK